MWRTIFFILISSFVQALYAQDLFTEYLQKKEPGKGVVSLHQSKFITDLVNGLSQPNVTTLGVIPTPQKDTLSKASHNSPDSLPISIVNSYQRVRANGYRIQVYSGANSRKAKQEAMSIGQMVKNLFPTITVYTQFMSPHWKCCVGDFKTFEEANDVYKELKKSPQFREAVIVKSKINVFF